MPHRTLATTALVAFLALLDVALPEPIVLDLAGAGIASLGLGFIVAAT